MARKNRKRTVGSGDLAAIAERELEKGNAKQALKHAKACYRVDRSESTKCLLQRAFLFRGKELHARSMFENARSVIMEMDGLGTVSALYEHDAARLRTLLGVGGADEPELDAEMRQELADQAVVFGPASITHQELQANARAVREALEAVEADEPERAVERVAAIDRDSPFADWKLFVRGLVAYYDQDPQRMQANWSRLAPQRAARRIAEPLLVIAGQQQYADAVAEVQSKVDQVTRVMSGSLVGGLRSLQRKMKDPESDAASLRSEVGRFMTSHAKSAPSIAQRLVALLVDYTITDAETDEDDLAKLLRVIPKPPLDPHLNRAFALMHELLGNLYDVEQYWQAYVKDLRTSSEMLGSQRSKAIALVYHHLANEFVETANEDVHSPLRDFDTDDSRHIFLARAETYLRKSCEADASILEIQLQLPTVLEMMNNKRDATACYRRLAKQFPDNFDVQVAAADFFIRIGQPSSAEPLAASARLLRPRDDSATTLLWLAVLGTAREAAKVGQIRLAQQELDKAEELLGPNRPASIVLSMRAAIAYKEGNGEQGDRFLQQTIEQYDAPVAGLLLVHSQAIRCGVNDRDRMASLKNCLATELKRRKKHCQAAGFMAEYIHSLQAREIQYRGLPTHVSQVKTYLSQSVRLNWSPDDLVRACRFALHEAELPLLTKLAKRGAKLFAKHPYFHYCLGEAQIMRGPVDCDTAIATKSLNHAIELNNNGDIKLEPNECQEASKSLSLLDCRSQSLVSGLFGSDVHDDDETPDRPTFSLEKILDTIPPDVARELDRRGMSHEDAARAIAKMLGANVT